MPISRENMVCATAALGIVFTKRRPAHIEAGILGWDTNLEPAGK
jgi:hypothetical protein